MPCPTCSHTLQQFDSGWFWCPRCGTLCDLRNKSFMDATETKLLQLSRRLLRLGERMTEDITNHEHVPVEELGDRLYEMNMQLLRDLKEVEECCRLPEQRRYDMT